MSEILAEIFKHNQWATIELLNFCKGHDGDVLDSSAGGMYGSAYDTLVHMVAAERRYASGYKPLKSTDVNEMMGRDASLDMLLASAKETGDIFVDVARGLSDDWLIEGEYGGEEIRMKGSTWLMQGLEPPELDGWHYADEG